MSNRLILRWQRLIVAADSLTATVQCTLTAATMTVTTSIHHAVFAATNFSNIVTQALVSAVSVAEIVAHALVSTSGPAMVVLNALIAAVCVPKVIINTICVSAPY
jgi:hypothetical protein